jgi:hypothetical protein
MRAGLRLTRATRKPSAYSENGGCPVTDQNATHKCAHPSCICQIPANQKYCSDYCKSAPETEFRCYCQHLDCRKNG